MSYSLREIVKASNPTFVLRHNSLMIIKKEGVTIMRIISLSKDRLVEILI